MLFVYWTYSVENEKAFYLSYLFYSFLTRKDRLGLATANNYNPSAELNDECCYNCFTSLGYSLGEYCNYNLDFILENEFNGLVPQ